MTPDVVAAQVDAAWAERWAARQARPDVVDAVQVLAGLNDEDRDVHAKTTMEVDQ